MSVLSGLIVSVDAFFIGLSLGFQKKCRFLHLVIINAFLLGLCFLGFFVAGRVYEAIPIDPDIVVGFAFIALGLWCIINYFLTRHKKEKLCVKSICMVGMVMSIEAMVITMGITIIFMPDSSLLIPVTVGLAHFGYSAFAFYLARTKRMQGLPPIVSHMISGIALIIYGLLALFVEIGI